MGLERKQFLIYRNYQRETFNIPADNRVKESVMNMIQLKRMVLTLAAAIFLSAVIPVSTPLYSNVIHADAASLKLNITNASVNIGETVRLKLIGTTKTVKWSSSDKTIATVSSSGIVTGLKKGTVKITAAVDSQKYISTIAVELKELTAEEIYEKCSKATVEIIAEIAGDKYNLGSGFFLDDGTVVTNFHVVAGADRMQVITYGNKVYEVEQVLGYDADIDLIVLKINSQNESLNENSEGITVGEEIYILGSPLGLTGTFADGMVSSASRKIENVDYIQVTAPMSPGNSGGPLLNKYGEVMGINTWQYADGQNLNFSINIEEVNNVSTDNPLSMSQFYQLTQNYINESDEDDTAVSSIDIQEIQNGQMSASQSVLSSFYGFFNTNPDYAAILLIPDEDGTSYKWVLPQ